MLLACATNLWAGDVVVYKLNTATTTIATSNSYGSIKATACKSDDETSEVTTANWKITLGSKQTNNSPKGLWLGANSSNKSNDLNFSCWFANDRYKHPIIFSNRFKIKIHLILYYISNKPSYIK